MTATTYLNTGLTNGTSYYYVVTASNAAGESANSTQVTATPMAAPTITAATPGNKRVTLTWTAVTGATQYRIKRATVNGGPYTLITTQSGTGPYNNNGLTTGTTYYYVISAINATGESVNSVQVSAVPN